MVLRSSRSHNSKKLPPASGSLTRAQRFPVRTTVAYREQGVVGWFTGRTINVSRTGVLFEADRPVQIGVPIQIVLEFAAPLAMVSCSGRVIRTASKEAGSCSVAATISRYTLLPQTEPQE